MRRFLPGLLALAACTEAGLEAKLPPGPPPVDDKLSIEAELCTRTPRDELFPVKILLVIDTSNSMAITDPTNQRTRAVVDLVDRYRGNPAVRFAVLAFDSRSDVLTRDEEDRPGFTANPDMAALTNRLDAPDLATDYQGALATAYKLLFNDMNRSSPEERARSKYVVVFFSDGNPDPQCFADPARSAEEPYVCDLARDEWPDLLDPPAGYSAEEFQSFFVDMEDGRDYNTDEQIVNKVEDIMELQETFNVNELRLHTGFLFDPVVMSGPFAEAFRLDRDAGITLMRAMKDAGQGTFTEFTTGGAISFLNINYTSVKKTYAMTNLIVASDSAFPVATGPQVDSDGDGVPDVVEDELRLCSYEAGGPACAGGAGALDTDGDGYSDGFEWRLMGSGFDPTTAAAATSACAEAFDTDLDGLRDCEEIYLRTSPYLFDTDGDRIPDGMEFRFGLDPLDREDARADDDSDGTRNLEEVLLHWTPIEKEPAFALPPKYEYAVAHLSEEADGRNCYEFRVDNLRLQTTRGATPDARGLNTVWIYFLEGPPNDPRDFGTMRVACVHAKYIAPDLKIPADGLFELHEDDFFDPMSESPKPCVGPDEPEEGEGAGGGGGAGGP